MASGSSASPAPSGSAPAKAPQHTFPDPSITLIEFSDGGIGVLLASRTDRDPVNKRIILTKVAYVRIEPRAWGFVALPEAWVGQDADGVFSASEPKSGKLFRYPSRRRYEVAFLGKDLFDCAIQCLKERKIEPLFELIGVSFGTKPGFSVEAGCLLAPDDYATLIDLRKDTDWVPQPQTVKS